jgi:hypothetical protein
MVKMPLKMLKIPSIEVLRSLISSNSELHLLTSTILEPRLFSEMSYNLLVASEALDLFGVEDVTNWRCIFST